MPHTVSSSAEWPPARSHTRRRRLRRDQAQHDRRAEGVRQESNA